jgi:hypothetical protein
VPFWPVLVIVLDQKGKRALTTLKNAWNMVFDNKRYLGLLLKDEVPAEPKGAQ